MPRPLYLPLDRVRLLFDPYADNPWIEHKTCIRRSEVKRAIEHGELLARPSTHTRANNIQRIAYLAVYGWKDAIEIDVGIPGASPFGSGELLHDGWHRLAAAIYRKDEKIRANVSGSLKHAHELFGVSCDQY